LTRSDSHDSGGGGRNRNRRTSYNNDDANLGYMDRDLSSIRDVMTALAVGTFVGLGTILGFFSGVLYSTPIIQE
jgi:hypothetical protein